MMRQRGFTYLETLVSVAILAIALAAIYQGYASGLRIQQSMERRGIGLLHAQSALSRVGYEIRLAGTSYEQDLGDGYHLSVALEPDEGIVQKPGPGKAPMKLHHVAVKVSWDAPYSGDVALSAVKATVAE